jgi:uncharacterized protein (TIGR02391 family)
MPQKRKPSSPPIEIREFTLDEINIGIKKLTRRIDDVKNLDPKSIRYDDAIVSNTEANIRDTILEVFGNNSPEFQKHKYHKIWHGNINLMDSDGERQSKFAAGIPQTITILKGLIDRLEEKREDFGEIAISEDMAKDFWSDIHTKITSVARSRYESAHYADAVESAFKEINACVKNIVLRKTGNEMDGAPLMHTAFSLNNPIIVLDDLSTESGRNIQQGYMEIFAGAMIGIRNPKAHGNLDIMPDRAKHFIYLASLLMKKIDERI